jgi:hypothetical protein
MRVEVLVRAVRGSRWLRAAVASLVGLAAVVAPLPAAADAVATFDPSTGTLSIVGPTDGSLRCIDGEVIYAGAGLSPGVACAEVRSVRVTGGDEPNTFVMVEPPDVWPLLTDVSADFGGGFDQSSLGPFDEQLSMGADEDWLNVGVTGLPDSSTDVATLGLGNDQFGALLGGDFGGTADVDLGGDGNDDRVSIVMYPMTGSEERDDVLFDAVPDGYLFTSSVAPWHLRVTGATSFDVSREGPGTVLIEPSPIATFEYGVYTEAVYVDTRGQAHTDAPVDEGGVLQTHVTIDGFQPLLLSTERHSPLLFYNGRHLRFVEGLFQTLLEREPDPSGLRFGYQSLDLGVETSALADVVVRSPEHLANIVRQWYREFLDRDPDPSGLAYWMAELDRGSSPDDIRTALLSSTEYFLGRAGGSTPEYVRALYADVLHREPDHAGQVYWILRLARGTSRAAVARSFLAQAEPVDRAVTDAYDVTLGRAPTASELVDARAAWIAGNELSVVGALIGSAESYDRLAPIDPAGQPLSISATSAAAAIAPPA